MHPLIESLPPREAMAIWERGAAAETWMAEHGVSWTPALMVELLERGLEPSAPPADPPRRVDGAALRALLQQARLTPRLQAVGRLCLLEGLSLRACGEQLGITRETVRVHLRRMRAIVRRNQAWRAARAELDALERAIFEGHA